METETDPALHPQSSENGSAPPEASGTVPASPSSKVEEQISDNHSRQGKPIPQEHEQLWELMSQIPRKAQRGLLMQCDLVLTCVDVTNEYIALGSNIGLIFLYNRDKRTLERLKTDSHDVVICIKLHHGIDYQLAVGLTSGRVRIFLLPSTALGQNKTLQKLDVKDLHRTGVTCIAWSTNGMKLFSGDKNGRVVVNSVDFDAGQCKSSVLMDEPKADSEIIQLSYDHKILLVSTIYRTVICRTDEDSRVIQVGQKERKILGNFGACFIPGLCKPGDAKMFSARPGCRVWHSRMDGTVENTYIFREVLSENNPVIPLLKQENLSPSKEEPQFGPLIVYRDTELVTWRGSNLFVLEPSNSYIVCVQSRIGAIVDVAVNNDEIFVLRKNTEVNLVRLAVKPEAVKHVYRKPIEPKLESPSSEESKPIVNLSKINEELKNKGQSAKGFFQKNVIGKLKNLDLKPGSRQLESETSVKSLIDGASELNGEEQTSPDLPPVVKLKTPDLPDLEVFQDQSASSSNSPSPEKRGSVLDSEAAVARHSELVYLNNDSQSNASIHGTLSRQLTSSSTSSNMQEEEDLGDIVFSHKIRKVKKRKSKDKSKDPDLEDDEDTTPTPPPSSKKISSTLKKLEKYESKSILPSEEKTNNDNEEEKEELNALRRADEILKKSLDVLKPVELPEQPPPLVPSSSQQGKEEDGDGALGYNQALKLKTWDKKKMAEDDSIKVEVKEIKTEPKPAKDSTEDSPKKESSMDVSVHSVDSSQIETPDQQINPYSSKPSASELDSKIPKEKPFVVDFSEFPSNLSRQESVESTSESTAEDFYSMYRRSDSSSSSVTSPTTTLIKSPETEAYLARPTSSRSKIDRVDSIEGKINYTANIFDEIVTSANTYSLSVSDSHVWFTDKSENIWYSALTGPKLVWRKVAGGGSQIAVSKSGRIVWRLHKNIAYAGTKITSKRPEGLKWVDAVKEVAYIAVDDCSAWYIKQDGKVMMQKGLSKDRPCFRSIAAPCDHDLKQIACCNQVVWAITSDMKLVYRAGITAGCEEGDSWEIMESGVESLFFGHVCLESNNGWAIDVVGRIWFLSGVTRESPTGNGKWWQVPISEYFVQDATALDSLKSLASKFDPQKLTYLISSNRGGLISASASGIWVCPEYKNILHVCRGNILGFRWEDSPPVGIAASTAWKLVCADLLHLDWGLVWVQQANGDIYTFPSDTRQGSMVPASPLFTCLSACQLAVWGLTQDGRVYARSGMGPYCPKGSSWSELDITQLGDAHFIYLSCNNQYMWAVDAEGMVYQRIGSKSPADQQLSPVWLQLDSFSGLAFNHIAVGEHSWMVWAVDNRRLAYVRMGITDKLPIGKEWKNAPGIQVLKLCISETGVWALNPQGEVFYRHGITEKNVLGDYWKKVPGLCACISVSNNDEVWKISIEGRLMNLCTKYLHRRDTVDACTGTMRSLSIGSDEGEWELV